MGWYADQVLPRLVNVVLSGREFQEIRARVASGLEGEVLEVGFGSGLNVPHYPPAITRLRAIDPATVGRRLAAKRVESSPVPIEYVGLPESDGHVLHEGSPRVRPHVRGCRHPLGFGRVSTPHILGVHGSGVPVAALLPIIRFFPGR